MTPEHTVYSRILRRETHSPRSGAAISVAIVLILILAWAGIEAALAAAHAPALIAAPTALVGALAGMTSIEPSALVVGGIVVVLLGLILVAIAVLPGKLARHRMPSERCAVVVDDNVIANAIARRISFDNAVPPEQITVHLGHRTVDVRVTPSSGLPLDRAEIHEIVAEELGSYDLRLRTKVSVAKDGVIA